MGFWSCICNAELIHDLENEANRNIILYTIDGYAYYARLQQLIDCKIAVLGPASDQRAVVVRHPDQTWAPQGTSGLLEEFTWLDLCTVVAITSGLDEIPEGFVWIAPH